ncbi:hypothetical protein BH23CHL5_BH23CHL5_27660 [soil metagenome]
MEDAEIGTSPVPSDSGERDVVPCAVSFLTEVALPLPAARGRDVSGEKSRFRQKV